jgi:hypothetical protein
MIDYGSADPPMAIDRVERARGRGDEVRLRMTGRWLIEDPPSQPDAPEALLVVQLQGRRHRFPADRSHGGAAPPPGAWQGQFTVPTWAVPSRRGQAAVWVGTSVIAVGPPGSPPAPAEDALPAPEAGLPAPEAVSAEAALPEAGAPLPEPAEATDPGREGPLANLLLKDTVAALHAELERRGAEAAQLRGALADAQSELHSRAGPQASLETAHGELRAELEQLTAAAARQRQEFEERLAAAARRRQEFEERLAAARDEAEAELARAREQAGALEERLRSHIDAEHRRSHEAAALREQLATAHTSRDGAISEAGGLRGELERLGAELTVMREQVGAHGGDLGEAHRLLADARALTEQLRGGAPAG